MLGISPLSAEPIGGPWLFGVDAGGGITASAAGLGTLVLTGTGAVAGAVVDAGAIAGTAAGLGALVVTGTGAAAGTVSTPSDADVTPEQVAEYMESALSIKVPAFMVAAATTKVLALSGAMTQAGYSDADRVMVQCLAATIIAAAGSPRRLASQGAPSGASRSFKTADRDLQALRRALTALDVAGITAAAVGPETSAATMFMAI